MIDAKFIGALTDAVYRVGFPAALCIGYLLKDWFFTKSIVETNTKMVTILETIVRDGVKCRHD